MSRHLFYQPLLIYVMVPLPLLGLLAWWAARKRRAAFALLGHWPSVQAQVEPGGGWRWAQRMAASLGLSVLAVASAGPQWGVDPGQTAAPGRDVVVVLDVSRSMLAEQPSRLVRSMAALVDLSESLRRRGGHRVALVLFAGKAKVACPLTNDYDHFRETVEALDPDEPAPDLAPGPGTPSGTRLGGGIGEALTAHDPERRGFQDILLVSDGDDPAHDGEWRAGVRAAQQAGVPVHVVGVGDPEQAAPIATRGGRLEQGGSPVLTRLDEEPLRETARLTGGVYVPAYTSALPLGDLFRDQILPRDAAENPADSLPVPKQRAAWFFAAALALLTLETLFTGRLPRRSPSVSPVPANLIAGDQR